MWSVTCILSARFRLRRGLGAAYAIVPKHLKKPALALLASYFIAV